MATVSLSPTPVALGTVPMSVRRGPLTSNPNVANSPLRGVTALNAFGKQKRSHATVQREELYGQAPPLKKQALENGSNRPIRSPSKIARPTSQQPQRSTARTALKDRPARTTLVSRTAHEGVDQEKEVWKKHHRAKFPHMVFYFESVPDDIRAKLTKRVIYLGARQESFFSILVTHVVTGRSIPLDKSDAATEDGAVSEEHDTEHENESQPQTINPSLLDIDRRVTARRKLFDLKNPALRAQHPGDAANRNKAARNNDVLCKAKEMGKKIWSLEKFQHILSVLLEGDKTQQAVQSKTGLRGPNIAYKNNAQEPNLLQLLHNERINGPSDRDPTAVAREMTYFKGPFIYISDMDEKQKPIMLREYAKVANKADGEWPQFRSVGNGRCPFVEEVDVSDKERRRAREEEKQRNVAREARLAAKTAEDAQPKPVTGKRTLKQMEDGHNRVRGEASADVFNPAKAALSKQAEARPLENAFVSRVPGGRLFAGEPVASGLQGAKITSAIRSQMISSTSGLHGTKAGTSKEVHGLQRKVLQKGAPTTDSVSRRQPSGLSADATSARSATMGRETSKLSRPATATTQIPTEEKEKEAKAPNQPLKSKKDLKPGYCENCQDKFRDFDEHILSRKHRKFADNTDNWSELDDLIKQLARAPRFPTGFVRSTSDF